MYRTLLLAIVAPTVNSIIVKDPPDTGNEYNYSYNIEDPSTGDSKSQHEVRRGDVVTGAYTVLDPDGTKRTVEYTADARNGFKAVVTKEPAPVAHIYSASPSHQNYRSSDYDQTYQYQPNTPIAPNLQDYYTNRYKEQQSTNYFTPANEIVSDIELFGNRQYFMPNYYQY